MPAKTEHVYRHRVVSRFQVTGHPGEQPFDFKNNLLRINDDTRNERFLDLVAQLHPRDRMQIVKINTEAAAKLESALGPRVSRTAMDTSMIRSGVKGPDGGQQMTQAQIDDLAEQQRLADARSLEQAHLDQAQADSDQAALDDAKRLIAEGGGGASDEERLQRVAEEEAKLLQAGQIDQSANQASAAGELQADAAAATTAVPAATTLKTIKK